MATREIDRATHRTARAPKCTTEPQSIRIREIEIIHSEDESGPWVHPILFVDPLTHPQLAALFQAAPHYRNKDGWPEMKARAEWFAQFGANGIESIRMQGKLSMPNGTLVFEFGPDAYHALRIMAEDFCITLTDSEPGHYPIQGVILLTLDTAPDPEFFAKLSTPEWRELVEGA